MRLPQLIGLSRALDLILTGRPIKAEEALQLGVANRVAKSGTGGGRVSLSYYAQSDPLNSSAKYLFCHEVGGLNN